MTTNLRSRREALGISFKSLAEAAHISQYDLAGLESDSGSAWATHWQIRDAAFKALHNLSGGRAACLEPLQQADLMHDDLTAQEALGLARLRTGDAVARARDGSAIILPRSQPGRRRGRF